MDVRYPGFCPTPIPYREAWRLQREVHNGVLSRSLPDTLLLLEHPPTYTAGKRTEPHERPTDGTEVIDVDRGGKITWHGPGQLVGYPIVRLPEPVDVVAHVRGIERRLIEVLRTEGIHGEQIEGRSGVWVRTATGADKIAAIGVRVEKGVTMHGFALNADCDLSGFGGIIPCGITDAGVTTASRVTGRHITVTDFVPAVLAAFDIDETFVQPGRSAA